MEIRLPAIAGISARPFGRDGDFEVIADLFNADMRGLEREWLSNADEVELSLVNTDNIELDRDILILEVGDEPVSYVLTRWYDEAGGPRCYRHMCKLDPNWLGRGIGTSMLDWAQEHLVQLAQPHNFPEKVFRTDVDDTALGAVALLVGDGYQDIQHDATLVRPDMANIPDSSLPDGVEIRPVTEDQFRTLWEADNEAFRDHWGFVEPTEKDYQAWFLDFPHRDQSLWKVAWHGDQVVGQVRSFINKAENDEFGRQRGWTEFISTARYWRSQGIATALVNESLRELRDRGMEEAALGVHVENPNGAYRLYQKLGFEIIETGSVYEKPLDL